MTFFDRLKLGNTERCYRVFLSLKIVCVLQNHFLDLEEADLGGVFVLLKLHGDVFNIALKLGDHDVLERIHAAAGFLLPQTVQ